MADETINIEVKSNLGDVAKDTKKATGELGFFQKGIKKIGTALKAAGIGLLVGLFAKLFQALSKNQKVVDAMATAMNFVSVAFSDLFKYLDNNYETIKGYLKGLFTDPLAELAKLAIGIDKFFIEKMKGAGLVLEGVWTMITNITNPKKMLEGMAKIAAGTAIAGKEIAAIYTDIESAVSGYISSTIEQAKRITAVDKAAAKAAATFGSLNAQLKSEAAEQERILADEFTSIEDKYAALEKLEKITESLHKAEKAQLETHLKQAQLAYEENASDENWIALQEQKIALQELENKQLEDEEALFDKKIAINDEWNIKQDEQTQAILAADEAVKKSKEEMASAVGAAIGALGSLMEEGTAGAKAAALAQIAIDTGVGFVQGLNIAQKSSSALGPAAAYAFPIFYATQIAAVLGAAGQAKQILGAGAGGGGGATPTATTPATPAPQMMSGAFDLSGGIEPEAAKAYVVTDEMTNSQNQLANIRRRATI